MLRIHIGRRQPWVDENNRVRSPFEQFLLLGSDARVALERQQYDLVPWEIGVVSDDWPRPEWSIPIGENEEPSLSGGTTLHVLGEEAALYNSEVRPVLLGFLTWLLGDREALDWFVKDLFVNNVTKRFEVELYQELHQERFGLELLESSLTSNKRLYTLRCDLAQMSRLLNHWWPSPLGILGGIALANGSRSHTMVRDGRASQVDLSSLEVLFESASSYANLGFIVLSRAPWTQISESLLHAGWENEMPVATRLQSLSDEC
jgi:hypothetical protein